MRTALSVLAGFSVWSVLWCGLNALLPAVFPGAFDAAGATSAAPILAGVLLSSVGFSLLSGAISARLARRRAALASRVLAGSLLVVGVLVQASYWDAMPLWFHLGFLGLLAPATLLGARLMPPAGAAPSPLSAST